MSPLLSPSRRIQRAKTIYIPDPMWNIKAIYGREKEYLDHNQLAITKNGYLNPPCCIILVVHLISTLFHTLSTPRPSIPPIYPKHNRQKDHSGPNEAHPGV